MSNKMQVLKLEKKFLAYLFSNKKYIAMTLGKINKSHLPNTSFIYSLLSGYYNKFHGIITDDIVDIMFQKKNLDTNTIVNYKSLISEIRSLEIGEDHEFEAIIEELEEHKKRREYLSIAELIINTNPIDCASDNLEKMENKIKEQVTLLTADDTSVRKEGSIENSALERIKQYEHIKNNPESIKTVLTGFKKIDDGSGGFRYGELIYIIGRKGDGKSTLMLNLAHNMWERGNNIILFSLEISKEDYERRFDARAAGVPSNGLKRGKLTEIEESLYKQYIENLNKGLTPSGNKAGLFYVVDVPSGCTPAFIEAKIDTVEQVLGVKFDVVISDYAGIMLPNVHVYEKRHQFGQIALDLKRIARRKECVVISAAQMNRDGKDEKADTSHVAESDQVADHLDWGIAIRSISESTGRIESFKARDSAPFEFHFTKKYDYMRIMELEDNLGQWDSIG